MWLFWLFISRPYQGTPAAETELPKLVFAAAWLHERSVVVPDTQVAVCLFVWNIPENALVPVGSLVELVVFGSLPPPDATETALPKLVFEAAWLHDKLVVVPDKQNAFWLFSWAMIDCAPVCAMAAFEVVAARTRSPVAIIVATMVNTLFVPIFCY